MTIDEINEQIRQYIASSPRLFVDCYEAKLNKQTQERKFKQLQVSDRTKALGRKVNIKDPDDWRIGKEIDE